MKGFRTGERECLKILSNCLTVNGKICGKICETISVEKPLVLICGRNVAEKGRSRKTRGSYPQPPCLPFRINIETLIPACKT